jgi:hypothetical protein
MSPARPRPTAALRPLTLSAACSGVARAGGGCGSGHIHSALAEQPERRERLRQAAHGRCFSGSHPVILDLERRGRARTTRRVEPDLAHDGQSSSVGFDGTGGPRRVASSKAACRARWSRAALAGVSPGVAGRTRTRTTSGPWASEVQTCASVFSSKKSSTQKAHDAEHEALRVAVEPRLVSPRFEVITTTVWWKCAARPTASVSRADRPRRAGGAGYAPMGGPSRSRRAGPARTAAPAPAG